MLNTLEYKGYVGTLSVDTEADLIHGRVINTKRDVLTFRGVSPAEVQRDFQEMIDEYIAECVEEGIPVDPPQPVTVVNSAQSRDSEAAVGTL